MKTTLVIDTTKAFTASVSTIPQFELGEQHTLRIEATGLDTGCKLGLAAYTLAGDPLFAVHDMAWETGFAEASFGTSTVQAVAALGERQRMEIIVGVDEYAGTAPNQTRKTIAQFKTVLYRDSYAGSENPETIEQAVAAVATATAQAVIATTQANLAIAAEAAVEGMLGEATTFDERLDTETAARIAGDEQLYDTISLLTGNVATKMDKVPGADSGKILIIAGANGSATASVYAPEDFIPLQPGATGQIPELLEDGSLFPSGYSTSSFMQKSPGTAGEILDTDAFGYARRSGRTTSAVSTAIAQAAGAMRHDTAQPLTTAAKAQACRNIGLAAPVAILFPELTAGSRCAVSATTMKFQCNSAGVLASGLFTFLDRYTTQASYPTYAEIFAQFNGASDGATFTLTLSQSGTSVMDVTVTRVSATSYTIGSVALSGAPSTVRLAFTNEGTTGAYVTKLYVNGTLAATSTAGENRTNRIGIGTASSSSYGWAGYLPHLNYWTT